MWKLEMSLLIRGVGQVASACGCRDESPDQGMLSVVQRILLQVHDLALAAYKAAESGETDPSADPSPDGYPSWDVRTVLRGLRSLVSRIPPLLLREGLDGDGAEAAAAAVQVLMGVKILFSRLWPVDQKSEEHPLWLLAEALGALCSKTLDDSVTHVIADSKYTQKAQLAQKQGKHIVSVRWLEASAILWERAKEDGFPVNR